MDGWKSEDGSKVAQPVTSQGNIVDIVSIHKQVQLFYNRSSKPTTENEHSVEFDFYLTQALPLLSIYQALLKERGKIQFVRNTNEPKKSDSTTCKQNEESSYFAMNNSESSSKKMTFPYFTMNEEGSSGTLSLHDCVDLYLGLVKRYFHDLYVDLGVDTLHKNLSSPVLSFTTNKSKTLNEEGNQNIQSHEMSNESQTCDHQEMVVSHDNMFVCGTCGYTPDQDNMTSTVSFKDINRVNLASKYLYDRITHFKDCINQFQGKQNCTIDPKVYNDLIEQFLSHDLIPSDYASLPKEVAFRNITKEHIMLFLKESKHTKHYEDVVMIHAYFTGSVPPDITHLENQLLHDFELLTTLYDKKFRHQDRKNFINTQYVLYQLLKRHKYRCKREDFNILKTIDRKFYHDDICKALFEELGWNFNPTF